MNIFFLHRDLRKCAQAHCNKHVVKMILEYTQILMTTHHLTGGAAFENCPFRPYRPTHRNHPCCLWVRESVYHYRIVVDLAFYLCQEYTYRYGKIHACQEKIEWLYQHLPEIEEVEWLGDPPQCVTEECKREDTVEAYREYYRTVKRDLLTYTRREPPKWL